MYLFELFILILSNLKFKITTKSSLLWILDGRFDDDYFQESHESSQFRQEFEMRKIKQASGVAFYTFVQLSSCGVYMTLYT